jgi:hypothetical protein
MDDEPQLPARLVDLVKEAAGTKAELLSLLRRQSAVLGQLEGGELSDDQADKAAFMLWGLAERIAQEALLLGARYLSVGDRGRVLVEQASKVDP